MSPKYLYWLSIWVLFSPTKALLEISSHPAQLVGNQITGSRRYFPSNVCFTRYSILRNASIESTVHPLRHTLCATGAYQHGQSINARGLQPTA
jgi:hypothetical protein